MSAISEESLGKVKSALKTIDSTFIDTYNTLLDAVKLYNRLQNFPEDMTEDRTPWDELRENMATYELAFEMLFTEMKKFGEKITEQEKKRHHAHARTSQVHHERSRTKSAAHSTTGEG